MLIGNLEGLHLVFDHLHGDGKLDDRVCLAVEDKVEISLRYAFLEIDVRAIIVVIQLVIIA